MLRFFEKNRFFFRLLRKIRFFEFLDLLCQFPNEMVFHDFLGVFLGFFFGSSDICLTFFFNLDFSDFNLVSFFFKVY